jgi:hypothetical protein
VPKSVGSERGVCFVRLVGVCVTCALSHGATCLDREHAMCSGHEVEFLGCKEIRKTQKGVASHRNSFFLMFSVSPVHQVFTSNSHRSSLWVRSLAELVCRQGS